MIIRKTFAFADVYLNDAITASCCQVEIESCINEFDQDDFLCLLPDTVHSPSPQHLVLRLHLPVNALAALYLPDDDVQSGMHLLVLVSQAMIQPA